MFPYRFPYGRFQRLVLTQVIVLIGGTAGTRTQDQSLKRALLYQLSYRPREARIIAELVGHFMDIHSRGIQA
jgi:hypothetical protein